MSRTPILQYSVEDLVDEIVEATRNHRFESFVIGIERPREYSREEHESAFRTVKIQVGERLGEIWPDRQVEFERPQLRIDLRTTRRGLRVVLHATPLFIGGRYRKLSREIPACRWMHMRCKGKGCPSCNYTGNLCGPSIQELAEPAVLAATGGEATFFHGAGREDVDVRMLGSGRPFVLEVRNPKRRELDLEALTRRINRAAEGLAEVHRLAVTTKEAMVAAKSAAADKTYRARIRFDGAPPPGIAERLESLAGAEIEQLSPTRVARRRGVNTVRRKRVISSGLLGEEEGEIIWEVRASAGTYIKELVSGDSDRTRPSIASVTGVPCECSVLDVMEIHWVPTWESGDA